MEQFYYLDPNKRQGHCGLTLVPAETETLFVVLTEVKDNPGMSITNCYEEIATQLYHTRLKEVPLATIRWIEHYTVDSYFTPKNREETFDEVALKDDHGKRLIAPKWQHCDEQTRLYLKTVMQQQSLIELVINALQNRKD